MNKYLSYILTLIFLVSLTCLSALKVSHIPFVINEQTDTQLNLNIDETDSDIASITLFYKSDKDQSFRSLVLLSDVSSMNSFNFSIQNLIDELNSSKAEFFEYYFSVKNLNNTEITFPELSPELHPFQAKYNRIDYNNAFVIISPDDLSTLTQDQKIIISIYPIKDAIDLNSIKVTMDGKLLKSEVTIDDVLLIINPPKASKNGSLNITANLQNGQKISSPKWTISNFKKKSAFEYYGSLNLISNTNSYSTKNDSLSSVVLKSNDNQASSLQLSGIYKWLVLKNSLYFSTLENKHNQKINRYYFGILTPMLDIHLGDYSPNYSEFTTYNKSVDGYSAKFKTKAFSLGMTLGEINRKVDSHIHDSELIDGTFKREHLSAKMTFGNSNSFAFSFNFAKNKDKINSLDKSNYLIEDSLSTDSLVTERYKINARDNIVLGSDIEWNLFSRNLYIFAEAAMSVYNSNIIPGVMTKDSLESFIDSSIPIDPEQFEDLIIINKNIEPFQYGLNNLALKAGFRANFLKNNLSFSFIQTGPSFFSLSSTSINPDKRSFRITDNFILNSSFFVTAGFEMGSNNIVDQREVTISNNSLFFNVNYQPNNLPYFSYNLIRNTNMDDLDIKLTDTQNLYMQFGTGYSTNLIPISYTSFNFTYGMGTDLANSAQANQTYKLYDNSKSDIGFNTIMRFNEFPLTSKIGINLSLNTNKNGSYDFEDTAPTTPIFSYDKSDLTYSSYYLNNEYALFNNILIPYFNLKSNLSSGDESSSTFILNSGAKYYPIKNTSISCDLGYKMYSEDTAANLEYNLFFTKLVISTSF